MWIQTLALPVLPQTTQQTELSTSMKTQKGNPRMQNPLYVRDILSGDLEKAFSTY